MSPRPWWFRLLVWLVLRAGVRVLRDALAHAERAAPPCDHCSRFYAAPRCKDCGRFVTPIEIKQARR